MRDTAKLASEFTMKPAAKTASTMVGVSQFVSVIFGGGKTQKRANEGRRKRTEAAQRDSAADSSSQITQDLKMGDDANAARK